ncbi:FYVE zinc finger domain-containing protein [Phytophthora infestans]|uniref:FYVE zinc finger domain-containing protein n=1 Tax=Phytophthora infestans TaxID=4787 RepID=A0A833S3B5_PHYIN|nr:FYVE zinc finger domain-containing protein [Phytophthora infestans]
MIKTLPLPPRFFKRPELTEREEQYLVGKAKDSAKALVDATRNNEGPVRWEEAGMHRGVQMYKGEARYPEAVVGESISYGCGATTIQSTLDEVADFFDLSTDAKVAAFVECNADVLDAQLLYVIEDPSLLNDPKYTVRGQRSGSSKMLNANQVTIKWFASEMPSKLLKNRDFLTVECQSTFMDVSGRRGWVRSYHSIKLPCCPELSDYNLVRGSFYHTGYVFVESERPGFLDVIFSAQVNMKGSMKVPTPLFMTIQKKRLSGIADLQKMITRRRLGAQRFLGDLELVPKSQRTRCNLCSAKFGLITRKARCRKCGEVVCASACSTEWEVAIPGQGVRKVRVCFKCAQNTDPSVFEDLPPSEQHSETNSAHDDEPPVMSVRAPGYQYERYNRSNSGSPTSRRRGQPSRDSDEYDSQGRGRRDHSGRRGPYNNSYEESYSQSDSYQDPDPEYPRTMEMPGEYGKVSLDSDRFTNDSGEYDDNPPSSRRRRDDRKYDPRNPDMYDHQTYGVSPPQYRDEEQRRALQRQQRALQQHQNKQRLLQRQQQQQEALMRRRQEQNIEEPDNYRDELESMSLSSSEFSQFSQSSGASSGAPSFLTSSLLAQHTKQMGKPGPVTKNERNAARRVVQEERTRRSKPARDSEPEPERPPPPSLSSDRPLTRLELLQVAQWEQQEAMFRNQEPLDLEVEAAEIVLTKPHRRRTGSSEGSAKRRGPELPAFFRSPHSSAHSQGHGAPTGESSLSKLPTFPTNSGQTVSVADDEDRLDYSSGRDDSINGLSMNFGSLLRPEDLRPTEESMCLSLDSSGQEHSTMGDSDANPGKAGASAAKDRADTSKTTVVKLYQRILELTNKQHELEAQPESDPNEKKEIAQELEVLYEKLHSEVEI